MPGPRETAAPRRRRADAERSIARILDAGVEALARDPDASMADIAREAGVVRATVYVHFPTRESLIAAVTHRAIDESTQAIAFANPDEGEPVDALRRAVVTSWRTLDRYHALVAINAQLPPDELRARHGSVLETLEPLIERGQASGAFRPEVPVAWHLATLLALIHTASGELQAGRIAEADVEEALIGTVLGAVSVAGAW